jgi:hypothetical protein
MTKSPFAQTLDEIARSVAPELKDAGFRKKGRTWNREVEPGLIHVIGFQMGPFPVGDHHYVIPGLRENLYGTYTVNVGVHIREVYELTLKTSATPFCQVSHCEIRARLGELATPPADKWWPLDGNGASDEMTQLLRHSLEVWFPLFASRDAILAVDGRKRPPIGWPHRGGMVQAIMWASRGDRKRSHMTLLRYWHEYQAGGGRWEHSDYILELAKRLEIELDVQS